MDGMDGSFGPGYERSPDNSDNGGRIESKSPVGSFKETLRLVPGAVATIPEFTADPDTGRPGIPEMKVQGYDFRHYVNELVEVLRLLGGEDEVKKHLFESSQITYLRERQNKGEDGLLLTNGGKNYFFVRLIEAEPIEAPSIRFLDSGIWKVELPGPPFGENDRLFLHQKTSG